MEKKHNTSIQTQDLENNTIPIKSFQDLKRITIYEALLIIEQRPDINRQKANFINPLKTLLQKSTCNQHFRPDSTSSSSPAQIQPCSTEPFPNIALIMSLLKMFCIFCLFALNFLYQLFFILILYCRYDQTLYSDSNFPFASIFWSIFSPCGWHNYCRNQSDIILCKIKCLLLKTPSKNTNKFSEILKN